MGQEGQMAGNKGDRAARAKDALKEGRRHKVTCGAFKSRDEALQRAAEARRAGVKVSLVIGKPGYGLLYAEGMTEEEAEAARKSLEAKKVKAEVSGQ